MVYNGSDKHKKALFDNKQDKLVAGSNITLTPQSDGTVEISAEGGSGTVTDVEVNSTSVVDEDGVAQITMPSDIDDLDDVDAPSPSNGDVLKYNSTTQKWENGEAGGDKFAPIIYSLDEREVGVWTDGKPLYEKTINFTHSTSWDGHRYDVAHGIANIDSCVDIIGRFVNADNKSVIYGGVTRTNGDSYSSNSNIASGLSLNACSFDRTNISIIMGSTFYQYNVTFDIVATLRYTKTTDVPGSGTWGTDGVPMVHYDGNEKIVGTWFGQTLYEKTIDCGNLPNATVGTTPHNISNLDKIVSYDGFACTSAHAIIPLPYVNLSNISNYSIQMEFSDTNIIFQTNYNFSSYHAYVTVQYTKSS